MIVKQIKLENIRSYVNETIEFPKGSLLLSGDIGSGKSTILLAIEFALFGIRGKQLAGDALLRNGKNKGGAELKFSIDDKEIIIKRNLKRTKDSVVQDSGYIIIGGVKKDCTAVELKTAVLELLGYPKELLTKTKNLIYRFTVYTPQEEMKHILFEEADERLDTLRKVFGIDKYKRIADNADIIIKEIKQKAKEMSASIYDLEEKKKIRNEKENEILGFSEKIKKTIPELTRISSLAEEQKNKITEAENLIKKFNEISKRASALDADLRNKLEQRKRNSEKIALIEKEISETEAEEIPEKEFDYGGKEKQILALRSSIKEAEKSISELNAGRKNSIGIMHQVISLDKCPTCHQNVSDEYKKNIAEENEMKIKSMDEEVKTLQSRLAEEERALENAGEELNRLRKEETEYRIGRIRIENLKKKKAELAELKQMQESIKKSIGAINTEKIEANREIENLKDIQEKFSKERKLLDEINEKKSVLEREKAVLEQGALQISRSIEELTKEIEKKTEIKNRISRKLEMQNWLEKLFMNLMLEIEKSIMTNAHMQFNDLFEQWFNMLIEDESMSIRLDDSFAPVVMQNSYENSISNLSGGEKTAASLAYRLALNKVINNMITGIKTSDLIILDEPTDGFSSEQLDRVRDVLEQINAGQLIIVSHESKIETFVDKIIRINKAEHISSAVDG